MSEIQHAWFSQASCDAGHGTSIYHLALTWHIRVMADDPMNPRPDEIGEVETNWVNDSPTDPNSRWKDLMYLGPVTRWVRKGRPSDDDDLLVYQLQEEICRCGYEENFQYLENGYQYAS